MVNESILEETKELRRDVQDLRNELAQSKGVVRRLRVLTVAVIVIFAVFGAYVANQVHINKYNSVVQCRNGNESREAFRFVWDFILGAELADPDNNPRENIMSELILPYIHEVWKERDCTDLGKAYPEPKKPELPKDYSVDPVKP